jgi:hypothetical protein
MPCLRDLTLQTNTGNSYELIDSCADGHAIETWLSHATVNVLQITTTSSSSVTPLGLSTGRPHTPLQSYILSNDTS